MILTPNTTVENNLRQIGDWIDSPPPGMPAPKFMVITGDFPNLSQTQQAIDNAIGADFLWYPVIGNHEISDNINNFYQIRDTMVPTLPNIVNYGPSGSTNTSYSWDYGNAHFVAVNAYWDGTTNPNADHATDGDIRPALKDWIDADLYEAPGSDRPEFVFVHEPAFPDGRHLLDSLDKYPVNRDAFVSMLNDNQVETLFCGHTHSYDHAEAPEDPLGDLHQVTNGYLRAYEYPPTITYVLVDGNITTFNVYRRTIESDPFTLYDQWTIGGPEPVEPPADPSDLEATAVAYNRINLTWTDNSDDESGFEIERSTTGSGGPFSLLETVGRQYEAYTDSGLDPETEYCYRVRAVNIAGPSDYTDPPVLCAETPEQPPVVGTCEDFENATDFPAGSSINDNAEWFTTGSPQVQIGATNGVAGSRGLTNGNQIFTWKAQPFDWNAPDFAGVNVQMDFQTDGSGHFDDDRIGWMITDSNTSSDNIFGVQLDPDAPETGQNIEAYWDGDSFGDNGGRTSIATLPALANNAWYRLRAEITKLTATSARIDVTLTALDASGNPGAVVASGSIADTAALPNTAGEERPNPAYFTAANIWPAFKNYDSISGGADNACFEIVTTGPVPTRFVPDVVGMTEEDAETAIVDEELEVGDVSTSYSDTVPAGSVISQDPVWGTEVALGSAVDLVVSLGQEPVYNGAGEGFDDFPTGTSINDDSEWFTSGSDQVQIGATNGVAGSQGLTSGDQGFIWTDQKFNWNDPNLVAVEVGLDFQTESNGDFNDDRVGWTISNTDTESDYHFAVQLDDGGSVPGGLNIEAYWDGDTFGDNGGRTSIADLPVLTGDAWYRLLARFTKLTPTSARIDVTLTALNPDGSPGAEVGSGSIADTAALPNTAGEERPNPGYFTPTSMWPVFKNFDCGDGSCVGAADNAHFEAFYASVPVSFAAFGDYGSAGPNELAVANLVASWNPDFIVTTGDNSYDPAPIDDNIGQYYCQFIGDYTGTYCGGTGSPTNRFFPAMGNHDWTDGDKETAYFNYFTLPSNERYYDFVEGPVHFFVIDSNPLGTGNAPGDGRSATSDQGIWLQAQLAASTAPWKIVYMHHPPYSSSSSHGSEVAMQWPYEEWGATAVLAGHDHVYERILRDDEHRWY